MSLFIKKDLDRMIADANDPELSERGQGGGSGGVLQRHLTAWNLSALGIGAIIGAGIFSLTGLAAANYAGPAIVYSFVIGGILCAFAGLCYAEMAAMVPVAGSAYAYSYATMGEFIAWIIGWDLILEYAFGAVTVSAAWSGYLISLLTKTLGMELTDGLLRLTKGPWETVTLLDGQTAHGIWNLPASAIALFTAWVLFRGIKESAKLNNIIVFVKVFIILAFIAIGWGVIDSANWIANPAASGLARLVPVQSMVTRHERILKFRLARGPYRCRRRILRVHRLRCDFDDRPGSEESAAGPPDRDSHVARGLYRDVHSYGANTYRSRELYGARRTRSDRRRRRSDRRASRLGLGHFAHDLVLRKVRRTRWFNFGHSRDDARPDSDLLRYGEGRPSPLVP